MTEESTVDRLIREAREAIEARETKPPAPAAAPSTAPAASGSSSTYSPGTRSSGSSNFTPYPTTLERNTTAQTQKGWPEYATRDQLIQQGFIPFGNDTRYVARDGRTYNLGDTGLFRVGYSATSNADRNNLANLIAQGAFQGAAPSPQAAPQASQAAPANPGTGNFYNAAREAGRTPDPATLGRMGAVTTNAQRLNTPEGYKFVNATPRLAAERGAGSFGREVSGRLTGPNATSGVIVPQDYNPQTFFQQSNDNPGIITPYDANGAAPGGENATLFANNYQTGELRGDGVGLGFSHSNPIDSFSSILPSYGYAGTGDPITDTARAAEIISQRDALVAGGTPLDKANEMLMAQGMSSEDMMNMSPGQSGAYSAGGYEGTVSRNDEGGYIFQTNQDPNDIVMAKTGASTLMTDPFAITNLRTGDRIIGSEHGQPERLHVGNGRIAVQPMGKSMSQLPNVTHQMSTPGRQTRMAEDGAELYYDDGMPVNSPQAQQGGAGVSQTNQAGLMQQSSTQPMSLADSERAYVEANQTPWNGNGQQGQPQYQPDNYRSNLNPNIGAQIGRQQGPTFAQYEADKRAVGYNQPYNTFYGPRMPDGTYVNPPTTPGTPTPPVGGGGGGIPGGGNGGGGSGGGGNGWPGTTVPNPIPTLPTTGTYPGTVPGTVQPTDAVAAATNYARDQRGRDIESQYYPQFGLPRQREITVPTMPTGVNPGAGLYYNTPDYGSQALGLQEQLAMLGAVGNSGAISQQIAGLRAGLTGDAANDAGIYAQIDRLNQDLSRARQADEYRRQLGVLGGGQPGAGQGGLPQRGPNDVVNPMPFEQPISPSTPDIPTTEFRAIHRAAPMETADLLRLDSQITQYGTANPDTVRQVGDRIAAIADEPTRQRSQALLAQMINRMNSSRPQPPALGVSPMPEDPIVALSLAKFGQAA